MTSLTNAAGALSLKAAMQSNDPSMTRILLTKLVDESPIVSFATFKRTLLSKSVSKSLIYSISSFSQTFERRFEMFLSDLAKFSDVKSCTTICFAELADSLNLMHDVR